MFSQSATESASCPQLPILFHPRKPLTTMIKPEEVFRIGHITRTHGVKGEVEIAFTDDAFERGDAEYLILEIDGILVPFFFTEYRYKGNSSALFTFEDFGSENEARRLVGLPVFYPRHAVDDSHATPDDLRSLRAFTGFRVFAIDHEESSDEELATYDLGEITLVDDSSLNVLLTITDDEGTERLVPFHHDFLLDIDMQERTLLMDIPLELLALND